MTKGKALSNLKEKVKYCLKTGYSLSNIAYEIWYARMLLATEEELKQAISEGMRDA